MHVSMRTRQLSEEGWLGRGRAIRSLPHSAADRPGQTEGHRVGHRLQLPPRALPRALHLTLKQPLKG
jgi:hypothetical protein